MKLKKKFKSFFGQIALTLTAFGFIFKYCTLFFLQCLVVCVRSGTILSWIRKYLAVKSSTLCRNCSAPHFVTINAPWQLQSNNATVYSFRGKNAPLQILNRFKRVHVNAHPITKTRAPQTTQTTDWILFFIAHRLVCIANSVLLLLLLTGFCLMWPNGNPPPDTHTHYHQHTHSPPNA